MEVLVNKFTAFGDSIKTEEALLDVFRGEHLVGGKLHYKKWVESKYASTI